MFSSKFSFQAEKLYKASMSYLLAGDTKEVCSSHKGFQLEVLTVVHVSLVYFLCCNTSYWKLAILAMSLLASQKLPLRDGSIGVNRMGIFKP